MGPLLLAVLLATTPEQRLETATAAFGRSDFPTRFAELVTAIDAVSDEARLVRLTCEALELGARGGTAATLFPNLQRVVDRLDRHASYASLAGFVVQLEASRTRRGQRFETTYSTLLPPSLPCAEWDSAGARVAQALALTDEAMAFDASPAQRQRRDKEARAAWAALFTRATSMARSDAERAGLFDLSLVFCDGATGPGCVPMRDALRSSLELRTKALGPRAPLTVMSALSLATLYEAQGRFTDAAKLLEQVEAAPGERTQRALTMSRFAVALALKSKDPWPLGDAAVEALRAAPGEAWAPQLSFLRDAAEVASTAGRHAEARRWLEAAIELGVGMGGAFAGAAEDDRARLAALLAQQKQFSAADEAYAKATAALAKTVPDFAESNRPELWRRVAELEREHAVVLRALGRTADAARVSASARQHLSLAAGSPP